MENEDLAMPVSVETELKEMIVNYIEIVTGKH